MQRIRSAHSYAVAHARFPLMIPPNMRRLLCLLLVGTAACSGGGSDDPATTAPDFLLPDVNEYSATSGQDVSPRDYLGVVSAWYFGDAG
jgi:hypothetical protein